MKCKIYESTKSPYGSNFILFMLTIFWTYFFCSLFWYNFENLITIIFHLWTNKIKAAYDEQIFMEIKTLFGTWYQKINLTLQHCIVSPEIINLVFVGDHCPWSFSIKFSSNLSGWYLQVLFDLFSNVYNVKTFCASQVI